MTRPSSSTAILTAGAAIRLLSTTVSYTQLDVYKRQNKYTVIATVTDKDADDNYTGELEVTWQINGAADNIVAFKNTYTADPTSVSLGAGKLIKGRDLKAGEFSFLLTDAYGKEIYTAKNEEN